MSLVYFFEVGKICWILQSLQKAIQIFQVRHFRFCVLHSTCQHVRNRCLNVKLPTYLLINTTKCFGVVWSVLPDGLESLKVLELQLSYPLEKGFRVSELVTDDLVGFFVI